MSSTTRLAGYAEALDSVRRSVKYMHRSECGPPRSTRTAYTWVSSNRLHEQEPDLRIATVAAAGTEQVPYTTGLLIGIGETRAERLDTLFEIRDLHAAHGHIQVRF